MLAVRFHFSPLSLSLSVSLCRSFYLLFLFFRSFAIFPSFVASLLLFVFKLSCTRAAGSRQLRVFLPRLGKQSAICAAQSPKPWEAMAPKEGKGTGEGGQAVLQEVMSVCDLWTTLCGRLCVSVCVCVSCKCCICGCGECQGKYWNWTRCANKISKH